MTISTREVGRARIVEVDGDVDLGSSGDLRQTLFALLPQTSILVLNLGGIRYIDSSGIATLIEVLNDSKRLNNEFVLFGLSPAIEEVFRLTHVNRIFRTVRTEQEAVGTA